MAINYNALDTRFGEDLKKYVEFASWCSWYPDLFLDLCKPPEGGITLHFDQRIFMRCLARFVSTYGCLPRGSSKTFNQISVLYVVAIWHPNITLSVTAQTKENAVKLLKDKHNEIMRYYPLLQNEIAKEVFNKNEAEVVFKNGARIDALANSQTSKGQRRKRINVEEAALLDNATFEDALEPIVEVPRYTCGKLALVNPYEMNQQINFFTTPGWRNSDEWLRCVNMGRKMVDLQGTMVLGSNWMLPCWYGRGSSKKQILDKMRTMTPTAFNQNYGGVWTGSSDGALVDVNKLVKCRTIPKALLQAEKSADEYYMGVDVARSQKTNNNQSSVMVGKVNRNPDTNRIISVDIVNIINIPNTLNFTKQAIEIKKIADRYSPRMVICDGNGLGAGLIDELLKRNVDSNTKEEYPPWATVNTDNEPEERDAKKCLYDLKAQSCQSKVITSFIDMVDSGKLKLLAKQSEYDMMSMTADEAAAFVQTDFLIEEVANLKLVERPNAGLSVQKVVRKIDKDRFSALAYMLYYISEFASSLKQKTTDINVSSLLSCFRPPKIK